MHMFIPNRIEIAEHPEIDVLPLTILFAKSDVQGDKIITGSALYAPDPSTLQLDALRIALTYRNRIESAWTVVIEYDTKRKSWKGTKSSHGKDLVYSSGSTWEGFFKHLSLSGLQNGEPCAFLNLPEVFV
jgi:glycerate-2-kinase